MRKFEEFFNRSLFSRFINSPAGRIFRVVAGAGFLIAGYVYRHHALGVLSMAWSVFPLSAGAFDICYISAVLGGPLSGAKVRGKYKHRESTGEKEGVTPSSFHRKREE